MNFSSMKVGPAYKFSVSCKLQLCILHNLGYLCQHVSLSSPWNLKREPHIRF